MRQAKIEEQYFTIDQFETDYVLPEGWAAGTLEELIGRWGILTDGDWIESKDQDPHGDVRLIQLADIGDGYYNFSSTADEGRYFVSPYKHWHCSLKIWKWIINVVPQIKAISLDLSLYV